jgi:hypothetical protein
MDTRYYKPIYDEIMCLLRWMLANAVDFHMYLAEIFQAGRNDGPVPREL